MTNEIEFGHHPDVDQISAFVEHVLPSHEQEQMLAHLAVCPECRTTVAMSLPPEEVAAVPAPQTRQVRWFTGWRLAVPTGALAAISLFAVYIHHVSRSRQTVTPSAQIAVSQAPAPPSESQLPTKKGQEAAHRRPETMGLSASTSEKSLEPKTSVANGGLAARQQVGSASARDKLATPQSVPHAASFPPAANFATDEIARSTSPQEVAIAPGGGSLENKPRQQATDANIAIGGPGLKKAAEVPVQLSLPSGLPVLSIATHIREVLAIDTRNNLFLSDDGGTTWKAVPVRWKGRAVKADLVSYGTPSLTNVVDMRALQGGTLVKSSPESAPLPSKDSAAQSSGASLTGSVSDQSGAAIPGATVTATASSGQSSRTATSDANGRFVLDALTPGVYDVKTEARGFQQQLTQGVNINASQPNVSNLILSVGAEAQTVTVDAASVELDVVRSPELALGKPAPRPPPPPVFEITTDNDEHWTSPDGMNWKRK